MRAPILACLIAAALVPGCSGSDRVIALGQTIRHDDFEYSVERVDTTQAIGAWKARGLFCIVTFKVDNHAKRVEHVWGNDIAYLVDEHGRQFESDAGAQQQLEATARFGYQDRYVTLAGDAQTTRLVFDLPPDAREPYLKVRGWFLMGDLFDGNQFKRVRVKLF